MLAILLNLLNFLDKFQLSYELSQLRKIIQGDTRKVV